MWIWGPERLLIESLLQPLTPDGVDPRTDCPHLENGGDAKYIQHRVVTMKRNPRMVMDLLTSRHGFSFLRGCVSYFW